LGTAEIDAMNNSDTFKRT